MSLFDTLLGRIVGRRASPEAPPEGPVDRKTALALLKSGTAPAGLQLSEALRARKGSFTSLPEGLTAPSVELRFEGLEALPKGLAARRISVHSPSLKTVGPGLRCDFLDLRGSRIRALPADLEAAIRIDLEGCRELVELPQGLTTGTLVLTDCSALQRLPAGLSVAFLDLAGCLSLTGLPPDLRLRGGRLNLRDCGLVTELPPNLGEVAELDLAGCLNLRRLPEGLAVSSWIDLAGSGIDRLPPRYDHVGVRWRGVAVPRRIVFEPDSLTPEEILGERNAEVRRVMMERFGYERLMEAAKAEELDRDSDAGGERRLLRVPLPDDEDLVCVSVRCPSTGHRFLLRVPPHMKTCRQAVAWTAGYENPDKYAPQVET